MDWDNDGLHDLLVGDSGGFVHIYLNTNSNEVPMMDGGTVLQAGGTDIDVGDRATPIVNDWNEDGKKDLLIGNFDGNIRIYLNEGTDAAPVFNTFTNLQLSDGTEFDIGSRAAPRITKWNNDGRKDLLVGEFEGYIYFLKNIGTNAGPVFYEATKLELTTGEPLRYMPGEGPRSRVYPADWNNDGHADLVVGGGDGRVMLFLAEP